VTFKPDVNLIFKVIIMTKERDSFRERRKNLEILVKQGKAFCEKHDQTLRIGLFYQKRCYAGRNGEGCHI
jgi:hypothetical protein